MLSEWKAFLEGQSVGQDLSADLRAARDGLVVADLSHWGLIGLSGEEAQNFLHGQITNDLRGLTMDQAVFAALCSAKGRMLANFVVFKHGADILVMLPESIREGVQKRLSMYILRAKVKLRDADPDWVRLGLSGHGAGGALNEVFGVRTAADPLSMGHAENAFAMRLGDERFDVFVEPGRAIAGWQALTARARPISPVAWDWLLVNAGVPSIVPETQDQFVPQMANMVELNGVSFQKGCYPGQEIVARSQYLGTQKRRLYLAHVADAAKPGDPVYSPLAGTQAVGMVANSAPAPEGGSDLLAVMQISAYESGDVRLGAIDGAALGFRALAYLQ